MSTGMTEGLHGVGVEELRRSWGWFVALGIAFVVLGIVALGHTGLATAVSVILLGWLLLFGGVVSIVHSVMRRRWGGFFLELFSGILYLIVGLILVGNPAGGAVALTLLIALSLMIGGVFRIAAAVMVQFQHWVWMLVNGVISLVLGVMIWQQWPFSGIWVIGVFVGVDLIFYGWSLVMLGLTAKGMPDQPAGGAAP